MAKIEDFGDRIEGARKHYAAAYVERLGEAVGTTLGELWPIPDWSRLIEEGARKEAIAVARAMRESFRVAPRQSYRRRGWLEELLKSRVVAATVIASSLDEEGLAGLLKKLRAKRDWSSMFEGKVVLYCELGHEKSLKEFSLQQGTTFMPTGGGKFESKRGWVLKHRKSYDSLGIYDTPQDAVGRVREAMEGAATAAKKGPKLIIFSYKSRPGTYYIGHKIGAKGMGLRRDGYVTLRKFDSAAEARTVLKENREALIEEIKRMRRLPAKHAAAVRDRNGPAWRDGDISPKVFEETFKPRGVQFGNSVTGVERQELLNSTYDALMDLADVLRVKPDHLFFGGRLGLAFGARGKGGKQAAAAHFEPRPTNVINLTRRRGPGSLSHEWFHALDHEAGHDCSFQRGVAMLTDAVTREGIKPQLRLGHLGEAVEPFYRCVRARTPMAARARIIDGYRQKPYWSKAVEVGARTFESAVDHVFKESERESPFLVSLAPESAWMDWAAAANVPFKDVWPFLHDEEQETYGATLVQAAGNLVNGMAEVDTQVAHSRLAQARGEATVEEAGAGF